MERRAGAEHVRGDRECVWSGRDERQEGALDGAAIARRYDIDLYADGGSCGRDISRPGPVDWFIRVGKYADTRGRGQNLTRQPETLCPDLGGDAIYPRRVADRTE